ncbi:MAG: glycoside hydrolase family 9 protein [Opitutaceae bacterium]|nr:glycoside hydrolase family 9 protein [Opitutaceae bacterium]
MGCTAVAVDPPAGVDTRVRVNTIGFPPGAEKRATVAADCRKFSVRDVKTGRVVFRGTVGPASVTPKSDTDETVHVADFSALTTPGRYRVEVAGVGRSADFTIGTDVWNVPFIAVMRAFYLWRCGTAVAGDWNGRHYAHAACHLDDGWLDPTGEGHVHRDGTGGWHDAGDYNKYVVNAAVTVGLLLRAWEQYHDSLAPIGLHLPESGNGTPDLLNEVRWELEWLFKMQRPDGRVYHKLSSTDFRYWGPPEDDKDPRYFSPWGTAATADMVAMMAVASRVYWPCDPAFADRCLAAARLSRACLAARPEEVRPDLRAFHTGAYDSADATHRLWADAEFWETTGDPVALQEFEQHAAGFSFSWEGPSWRDVRDLALGTYLLSRHPKPRDPGLVGRLTASLLTQADAIAAVAKKNAYGRPLGDKPRTFFWGDNGAVAAQTYILQVANTLHREQRYREGTLSALAYLCGRNYYGRSYVTGLGFNPPEHPHDRRGEPAWPGYLVGGPWPDGRAWHDDWRDFRTNEVALNWNAALVYALAGFVHPPAVRE